RSAVRRSTRLAVLPEHDRRSRGRFDGQDARVDRPTPPVERLDGQLDVGPEPDEPGTTLARHVELVLEPLSGSRGDDLLARPGHAEVELERGAVVPRVVVPHEGRAE